MIYITGDTHGGVDMRKLSRKELKRSHIELTENDHLVITGDFGFPFTPDDIKEYENNDCCFDSKYEWIISDKIYMITFPLDCSSIEYCKSNLFVKCNLKKLHAWKSSIYAKHFFLSMLATK